MTHIRICTQVCKFLEIFSDVMCCLLRPDLHLRWPSRPAPLSVSLACPPHTCLPHAFLSPYPLCSPLPHHPLIFSLDWLALSFHHCALWTSVSLGQESENFFFFFAKIQIENIVGFECYTVSVATIHLCCCSTKTGKDNTSVNGCSYVPIKLYFQNQVGGCS